ncbi:MAG: hypothetical protein J5449_13250 [Oscillospiraceae bacterium]|nr:hypothetical protein [Oscillospiraceae bacterium]
MKTKRISAFLTALMMCLTLLPAAARAEGDAAEVWSPDMQTRIGTYASLAEALAAANQAGMYAGVKLLQDVTVGSGTTLTLNDSINLFLNNYTLTLESGSKITKGESLNAYPAIDLWNDTSSSLPSEGTLVIGGTLEADLYIYDAAVTVSDGGSVETLDAYAGTVNISGGAVHALITDGGTYNISGGVMCLDMFDNNGYEDVAVTVSGDACLAWSEANGIQVRAPQYWCCGFHLTLEGGYFDADPSLLYRDRYWHINDGGSWTASTLSDDFTYYIKSGGTYTEIAKDAITDENLTKSSDEDGSIFVCYADVVTVDESQIEEYSGQTDWAAGNSNLYRWRIRSTSAPSLAESSVTDQTVTWRIANVPANALLIAACYDEDGTMSDVQTVDVGSDASGTLTMQGTGTEFRLMLVDKTTYAPLCRAWTNNG